MSWRVVVITKNCKIDYKMGFLEIRSIENFQKIHLSEIAILLIESTAVSLTTYLLNELIQKKIKVIFCDHTHQPHSELIPINGSFDSPGKLINQIRWSKELKNKAWTKILFAKIQNQKTLLLKSSKSIFNKIEAANKLDNYCQDILPGDPNNRESAAARIYFSHIFGPEFSRDENINLNSALNYGYAIILSAINREISTSGYTSQIGIFHSSTVNPFNLACDLIEPLRPFVDQKVISLNLVDFSIEEKHKILSLLTDEFIFDGKKQTMLNIIKLYCQSFFRYMSQTDTHQSISCPKL